MHIKSVLIATVTALASLGANAGEMGTPDEAKALSEKAAALVNEEGEASFAGEDIGPTGDGGNSAPTISGSPAGAVTIGDSYSFSPNASDPDGDALTVVAFTQPLSGSAAFNVDQTVTVTPVLDFHEAAQHPHNKARDTFVEVDGVVQAAPAPRFDRTPPEVPGTAAKPGEHTDQILKDAGMSAAEIAALRKSGAVA